METIVDTQFVIMAREKGRWGRGNSIRSALRDAGWEGNIHEFPLGIEAWVNLQAEEDRCSLVRLSNGDFKPWDSPTEDNREEPVRAGCFAPPLVTGPTEEDIVFRGALIKIW